MPMIENNKSPSILLLSLLLLLAAGSLCGQNAQIDSLKQLVQTGQRDTAMVTTLNNLSIEILQNEDISGSLVYSQQALELADRLGYLKGKAYAEKNMGMAYYYQGDYVEVLNHWTKSLKRFEAIKDTLGTAKLVNNLGAVYYSQGSHAKALDYYLRSLSLSEKTQDPFNITQALLNLGGLYTEMLDYEKALEFFNKIEDYRPFLKNSDLITSYLMGVGEVYFEQGLYDDALKYYEEALASTENITLRADNLIKLGLVEFKKEDEEKAIDYLNDAYRIAKNNNQQSEVVQALIALASVYKQGNYTEALTAYKEAEELAKAIEANDELRDIYDGTAQVYAAIGDFSNAYKYQTLFLAQKDLLFNLETDDKIRGLQFDFELEKKEDELVTAQQDLQISELEAKRQQYVIYGTVLGLVLVFVLAIGSYKRYRYMKKTNKIIESEKDRSENLLRNILPDETALELKEHGKVKAKKFESVTVMFTDFKGFTRYSESLSPEELVQAVDYFFSKFDAVMDKYDLEKIKTIGDAYMCAGGLPFPTDDHHLKMVQAGFEIAQIMEDAKKNTTGGIMNIDVRIGINTGPVVSGVVGTRKFAYDIWGDAVNVASRMESMSEPGKINVSESTYLLIKDTYECEHRGQIHVKNKGMMDMYFVHGLKEKKKLKSHEKKKVNI
jgi:class 3 adenylate cyclase